MPPSRTLQYGLQVSGWLHRQLVDAPLPPPEEFPFPTEFNGGRGSCDCSIPGDDPCAGKDDLTVGKAVIVYDCSLSIMGLGMGGSTNEDQWEEEAGVVVAVDEVDE